MRQLANLLVVIASYIIGLFPSAYITGRLLKGVDIRRIGDRNAGAANVYRNISHIAGITVLVTDIGKGAIAILIAQAIVSQPIVFLCGVAVVAGHNWPIFLKFKGGRGLATTIGVLLALLPAPMTILLAAGVVSLWKTGNLLITGSAMFAPLPLLAWLSGASGELILYSIALPCLAGIMHLVTTRHLTKEQKKEALYMR
jgi:glycerol-3-phosphate acyltransferase PlsY